MGDEAMQKKLNYAKKAVEKQLQKTGYKTECTSNKIYCIDAYHFSQHRIVAVGIREIVSGMQFKSQIRQLEKLPNPAPFVTSKEIWIKEPGEHNFKLYYYRNRTWIDEDFNPTKIFN